MLYYFYRFNYADDGHADNQAPAIILNFNMMLMADKYFVEPLQVLARDKFTKRVHAEWDQASFGEAVSQIYDNDSPCVSALKQIMLDVVRTHSDVLFADSAYVSFQQSVRDTPEFLFDWGKECASRIHGKKDPSKGSFEVYKCPGHGCTMYDVTFCISKSVPENWRFACPLRCSKGEKDQGYWKQHLLKQ